MDSAFQSNMLCSFFLNHWTEISNRSHLISISFNSPIEYDIISR